MKRSASARICFLITIISLGSLAFALILEHFFHVDPCILCTYQRIPYVVTAGFGLFGYISPLPPPKRRIIVSICGVAFVVCAGLAAYHVGIEEAWWSGTPGCTGESLGAITIDDLKMALNSKPVTRCDDVPFTMFGLSLPSLNAIFASALALLTFAIVSEGKFWREKYFQPRR